MKQYRCGECGKKKHKVYVKEGDKDYPIKVVTKCCTCGSKTQISLSSPKMELRSLSDSGGSLAVF